MDINSIESQRELKWTHSGQKHEKYNLLKGALFSQLKSENSDWWMTTTPTSFQNSRSALMFAKVGKACHRMEICILTRFSEEKAIWS